MRYVLAFVITFCAVVMLIPVFRRLAVKIGFVDRPVKNNERKIHRTPVPLLASIPMFTAFAAAYLLLNGGFNRRTLAVVSGSLLILGIGMVDDWYKTRGKEFPTLPKFIVQISAAVLVYFSGIQFTGFANPFSSGYVLLPEGLQFVLTVTWIFGVTTVINFSDGIDGLAGGLTAISGTTLFIVAMMKGRTESAVMSMLLVGITMGYLLFNRYPAKVYMGDAGATFLGFILGIIALDGAFKQATALTLFIPILALGVPIFDNLYVVLKRLLKGKPVYMADSGQIHYRLLSSGLNQKQAVSFLYLVNTCLCLASIILLLLRP